MIRDEERQFMSEINQIMGENFWQLPQGETNIELSTTAEDTKESFDMVYQSRVELSVRIRKNYYLKYCDFTIRTKAKGHGETEIDKLLSGKGSIYLYAWKSEDGENLHAWVLVDINKIRNDLKNTGQARFNSDGTEFKGYDIPWISKMGALVNYHNLPPGIQKHLF